jgi:hypothetical protein
MSEYDEAERHAIKELDPPGYCRWQMPELDADLEWYTWLESQVAPPVGMPQLRCDCVAGFRSRSGQQPPWACLIEAQAQPIPRMAVWVLIYLGLLHEDLRHGPHDRDRFLMMAAVINLTDTTLSTSIDWLPPRASPASGEAPIEQIGLQCRFWVRDVRKMAAGRELEEIAQGKTALCILPWVPLMIGGHFPEVLQRWQELAKRQEERHVRADYVALALVFAALAGCEAVWSAALKEFDVKESRIAQQWIDRGIEKGLTKGTLVGKVNLCQELLKQPLTPEKELSALPEQDLAALLAQLRQQLPTNGS